MNISEGCWDIGGTPGDEFFYMTREFWEEVPFPDKYVEAGVAYYRSPFNRHWLMGVRYLPVRFVSMVRISRIKSRKTIMLRKESLGLAGNVLGHGKPTAELVAFPRP